MSTDPTIGTLFAVATPIGNLGDFSKRGKEVLSDVNLIACEDTRRTKKLLSHFDIHTPTESYHGHSSDKKQANIVEKLKRGGDVALVSDAGTPAISDPGMRLVQAARSSGAEVVAVPGPSSITAALSISGLPAHAFTFLGFVPRKKGRETFFSKLKETEETSVFFESPHRFEKTLVSLADTLSAERTVVVCRELTKKHESVVAGSIRKVKKYFEENDDEVRGEFVLVVEGRQ